MINNEQRERLKRDNPFSEMPGRPLVMLPSGIEAALVFWERPYTGSMRQLTVKEAEELKLIRIVDYPVTVSRERFEKAVIIKNNNVRLYLTQTKTDKL